MSATDELLQSNQRYAQNFTLGDLPMPPARKLGLLSGGGGALIVRQTTPSTAGITQRIPIEWTPCTLGGSRPWFRCEAYSNGRYCGRRVALLYSAGRVFACRHCRGLVYASQQEPVRERGITTARKIQMRLGGGESVTGAFPEKPKGMHWRRYKRLRRRHAQAFERSLMGLAKSAERLERWLFR